MSSGRKSIERPNSDRVSSSDGDDVEAEEGSCLTINWVDLGCVEDWFCDMVVGAALDLGELDRSEFEGGYLERDLLGNDIVFNLRLGEL